MRNRCIALIGEAVVLNLLAIYLIWKLYVDPRADMTQGDGFWERSESGVLLMVLAFVIVVAAISIEGYFLIIKPYSEKLSNMEKAMEESKKAEAIRKEFVANVSHELKTPLTSISGFIETLQEGAAEDPEIRTKFIDIIAIETSRLKRLINDLLVLSDIENKRSFGCGKFNVKKAVERTIEALRPIADGKKITVLTQLDDRMTVSGSEDRFCQMMMNLIENAIKYSDEGKRIWVKAYADGDHNVVSVKDEGIGIAPEHHERLFERFYRVDKSRSKKAGGTGLGLSIVKHIAVLLGATLKVESCVGKGSEFFVIFKKEEEDIA